LQDLAVLTPSLIVCAAFLTGVFVLLRREMAPRRRDREGDGSAAEMSAGGPISEQEETGSNATSGNEETADQQTGRRSQG
jgi:flagellar biosynthesis/type III secretory pathway M-ring protein FliF/YscJ